MPDDMLLINWTTRTTTDNDGKRMFQYDYEPDGESCRIRITRTEKNSYDRIHAMLRSGQEIIANVTFLEPAQDLTFETMLHDALSRMKRQIREKQQKLEDSVTFLCDTAGKYGTDVSPLYRMPDYPLKERMRQRKKWLSRNTDPKPKERYDLERNECVCALWDEVLSIPFENGLSTKRHTLKIPNCLRDCLPSLQIFRKGTPREQFLNWFIHEFNVNPEDDFRYKTE